MQTPPPSTPHEVLLQLLAAEEQLLRTSTTKAREVHAALRCADLVGVNLLGEQQERLAAELKAASQARLAAAQELSAHLNLSSIPQTLGALADAAPEPLATDLRQARDTFKRLAAEFDAIQTRNANLIGHLRSFFRGVLADVTGDDAPDRYGPTGGRLAPTGPVALRRGHTT